MPLITAAASKAGDHVSAVPAAAQGLLPDEASVCPPSSFPRDPLLAAQNICLVFPGLCRDRRIWPPWPAVHRHGECKRA
jgi:hypothetical protein